MTDRSILQRYTPRVVEPGEGNGSVVDIEVTDDLGAFGWLRGIRERAVMLELRKKDGNILAVGYGYLDRAEFDPSDGITLCIGGHKIRIKGRNLNAEVRAMVRLFQGITRHRVPWVQEANESDTLEADDNATVIDSIVW